jgi:hypothetical protein
MGTVCSRNSRQVTAEELALKYLEEDEEYQQQQNEIEERQERQREAIKHVMTYFYPYSNINTRIAKHPKGSPKAGQKYMWITRGGRRSFSEPREANYPECVTVDRNGDVYVTEHTDKDTYCITSREIFAANDIPIRPEPPFLSGCGQNNLAVEWVPILARVVSRPRTPRHLWHSSFTNKHPPHTFVASEGSVRAALPGRRLGGEQCWHVEVH